MIITIDGPAASGKSTVAQLLAQKLDYYYLYSGMLYRGLAYFLQEHAPHLLQDMQSPLITVPYVSSIMLSQRFLYTYDEQKKPHILLDGVDVTASLKTKEIDHWASVISTYPAVREVLVAYQRSLAKAYNCIADGRDCGTRVFPDAAYKFFLTASLEVRAHRWQQDQSTKGHVYTLEQSIYELKRRDERDTRRALAPLIPALDACIIDNSHLTIQETVTVMLTHIGHITS